MKLIVTIDTEEDNWGHVRLTRYTCENIARIPALQEMFDHFNVKPTYLLTYVVATNDDAVSILTGISGTKRCEIGAHCHPWNTPPLREENTASNSMLCNLAPDLQYAKMKRLGETIRAAFGAEARSFRSGRFGYNAAVARNLHKLGYEVDTSMTPFVSWARDHGPDFSGISPRPFRFAPDDASEQSADGALIEIPTTIGFLQRDWVWSNKVYNAVTRRPLNKLRLAGVLDRLGLLQKAWLSPEMSDGRTMIKLAKIMMRNGYDVLNLMFHSPSLQAGLTPFTRTHGDEKRLLGHLREFLAFASDAGIEPIRLAEIRNGFMTASDPFNLR